MAKWTPHPHPFEFTPASVKRQWAKLHAGDAQAPPANRELLSAWTLLHNGHFFDAAELGMSLAKNGQPEGATLANQATCVYANYLEKREKNRLDLYWNVSERAKLQQAEHPGDASAFYWQAYALGRYSQGISVAKALAQGLGRGVKSALERTIELSPTHADAHIALATFHAEVIDKVGALIGGMTNGAKKTTALRLYAQGLKLHAHSASGLTEYANGLVMLEGDAHAPEADRLYRTVADMAPIDAVQWLQVEMARADLAES